MSARSTLVTLVLALAVLAPAGSALAVEAGPVPATAGGTQLWESIGHEGDTSAMTTSPDGKVLYVAGTLTDVAQEADLVLTAYNARTGSPLWSRRYINPDGFESGGSAIALSPDGSVVYVTGRGENATFGDSFTTVAYDASTGKHLWTSLYNDDSDQGTDLASAIAVSPDGQTVYVNGNARIFGEATYGCDTVAYSAATGTQLWAARYDPSPSGTIGCLVGRSIAVGPGNGTVYEAMTTYSQQDGIDQEPTGQHLITVAYSASTGAIRWQSKYKGPANGPDSATAVAISQNGHQVFVTGNSQGRKSNSDYATISYAAGSGKQAWVSRYNGPANRADVPASLTIGLGGKLVIVTGESKGRTSGPDFATVAYAAATGHQVWAKRYNGTGNNSDLPAGIAIGDGGRTVTVTGLTINSHKRGNMATVSYDAATGAQRWAATFAGPGGFAQPGAVAADQAGDRVFVSGVGTPSSTHGFQNVIITVAYQA